MARRRKKQTLADYVAIAFSPVLIMLLVGSLVFFLLEVMYTGTARGRVQWVLFWFVFATVLIARIGIEQGRSHAATYAGLLALVCSIFAYRFLDEYLFGVIVLFGVVWWCADKLTWDCTFIDDTEDASGEGLLQQAGIDQPEEEEADDTPQETEKQRRRRERRERLLKEQEDAEEEKPRKPVPAPAEEVRKKPQHKPRKHAPGVWVVYFSLLALPLFGVGQAFLPMDKPDVRQYGFQLLWVYVASALGLLLTTSFLGLRRYLRQRNMQMPIGITAGWLTTGATIAAVILFLCLLIPRPQSETSVTALLDEFVDDYEASHHAMIEGDEGKGEGKRIGEHREDEGEPGSEQKKGGAPQNAKGEGEKSGEGEKKGKSQGSQDGKDGQQNEDSKEKKSSKEGREEQQSKSSKENQRKNAERNRDGQEQQNKKDRGEQGNERDKNDRDVAKNERDGDEKQSEDKKGEGSSESEPPSSSEQQSQSSALSKTAEWVKWILYVVIGCVIVWALWKNRLAILEGAREFFRSLVEFWRNLFNFGRKREKEREAAGAAAAGGRPRKRFADYDNPFFTGEAHRMRPDALVIYTQEAFRAFGYEQGVTIDEEMTAIEFGRLVEERCPALRRGISFLTQAYSRILFAERPPIDFEISRLEALWRGMTNLSQGIHEPLSV